MHVLYNILAQTGLPGIPRPNQGVDLGNVIVNALFALGWAIIGALIFTLVVAIAMRVFSVLTPGMDEIAEIRNGNVAVAMVMFAFLLSVSAVVAAILLHT
ncbi:MAG: hypothetical protein DLM69_01990 [Candidatus Chloroheliales bacterium]|nr:MAG: hypothetical protein DLM69_01990 [Chloroflexota bacterium]